MMDEINPQPNITIQTLGSSSISTPPMPPVPQAVVAEPSAVVVPNMEPDRVSYADAQIQEIEVAKIAPNPYQPRKTFDPTALKSWRILLKNTESFSRWS